VQNTTTQDSHKTGKMQPDLTALATQERNKVETVGSDRKTTQKQIGDRAPPPPHHSEAGALKL